MRHVPAATLQGHLEVGQLQVTHRRVGGGRLELAIDVNCSVERVPPELVERRSKIVVVMLPADSKSFGG